MHVNKKAETMSYRNENKKEFVCKQCGSFFDLEELDDGKCPDCGTDEDVFVNDLNEEE